MRKSASKPSRRARVDVANVVADVTYAAFYGRLPGRSSPLQKIRGIAL